MQIVYTSTAVRPLGADDLDAIRIASERNNSARGLTGFLLYQGGRFYGLIEGPRRALMARMEKIIADPRHRDLRVLREADVSSYRFRNWTLSHLPDAGAASGQPGPTGQPSVEFIVNLSRRLR